MLADAAKGPRRCHLATRSERKARGIEAVGHVIVFFLRHADVAVQDRRPVVYPRERAPLGCHLWFFSSA